jgi:glutathione S-transferase
LEFIAFPGPDQTDHFDLTFRRPPHTPDGQPDRAAIERVLPDLKRHIGVLDKAVAATGYLGGADFSYADINILPLLAYLRDLPESGALMAGAKELAKYFERHSQRASFKATVPPPMSEIRASAS